MPKADICVILNAKSGKRRGLDRETMVRDAFRAAGAEVEIRKVRKGSELLSITRKAAADGFGTIVAAGGDGTICGVADVLQGSETRMGVLPMGTFNYFARSLGIPETLEEAAGVIAAGAHRPMRTGKINGRLFLNNTSLGAYAAILEIREDIYKRWGRSRVVAYCSTLYALMTWRRPLIAELIIDGMPISVRTPLIFVVNNAFQLDQVGLPGRDCIERGECVIFVAPNSGRWGMLRHAFALATGLAIPKRNYEQLSGRDIRIRTVRRRHQVALDGERGKMEAPFDISLDDHGLNIVVPADRLDEVR